MVTTHGTSLFARRTRFSEAFRRGPDAYVMVQVVGWCLAVVVFLM